MINYTERISLLMRDIVTRVPRLAYIDPDELLVFARYGRRGAAGAFATCHCMCLPQTEPGYYYWRDRQSGRITRRSRWFVTKSPLVYLGGRRVQYLISFALPRFCDQTLRGSRKEQYYSTAADGWLAKLDTILHELYHIDPKADGIRRVERCDGGAACGSHGRNFLQQVSDMVREYLATGPDPATYEFLRYSFAELQARYTGVVGTTFRTFPSFPQRYIEVLPASMQPDTPTAVRIQPLQTSTAPTKYTDHDLVTRQFLERATLRVSRRESRRDWQLLRAIQMPQGETPRPAAAQPADRTGRKSR
jgi:hypothetical protein